MIRLLSMTVFKQIFVFSTSVIILFSCEPSPQTHSNIQSDIDPTAIKGEDTAKEINDVDFIYDETADFLSGKKLTIEDRFYRYSQTENYNNFQAKINSLWIKANDKITIMREWKTKELAEVNSERGTLFYPFSGADFLHANIFFEDYDTIIMCALEPVGVFPNIDGFHDNQVLGLYMDQLSHSLNDILKFSFFRTLSMIDDFKNELDGTLPLIVHFLKRTDHELIKVERVRILDSGDVVTSAKDDSDQHIGNRFYFKKNDDDRLRVLYYFGENLQNTSYHLPNGKTLEGVKEDSIFFNFLRASGFKTTYLKSASYLLHRSTFSLTRNFILDNSSYILQDDSGIPFKYFDNDKWKNIFYGTYSGAIPLFEERLQEDLVLAFKNKNNEVRNLPFGIGYKISSGRSNLFLAKKMQ